jgi:hypothetical protein
MKNNEGKNRPAGKLQIGNLRAAIWQNESSFGPWYTVQFCRVFRDKSDGSFKESDRFGRDDVLVLSELARKAFHWMVNEERRTTEKANQRTAPRVVDDVHPSGEAERGTSVHPMHRVEEPKSTLGRATR